MKKILFLNGLTEHAPATYQYALKIAEHFQASLTMLYVSETSGSSLLEDVVTVNPMVTQRLKEFARIQSTFVLERLRKFVTENTVPVLKKVPIKLQAEGGELVYKTVAVVREMQPDLIVMGLHRHNRVLATFYHAFSDLTDLLPCPVLLIPARATYSGLRNLLYVTEQIDLGEIPVFQGLQSWSSAFHFYLQVLSMQNPKGESEELISIKQELQKALGGNGMPIIWKEPEAGDWIYENRSGEAILEFAHESRADLIVLKAKHQGFWASMLLPSLEKRTVYHSDIPVLVGKWTKLVI